MATAYIQLKNANDGSYYKARIFFQGPFGGVVQPREVHRTLTGKLSKSIGVAYRVWSGAMKIAASPPAGDITYAKMEEYTTGNTAAKQTITMIDHLGVTHNVMFTSDFIPESVSPIPDGSQNYWILPFEMEQQ